MKKRTAIYQEIRAADAKVQYDEHVKRILSLRIVLAWILQGTIEEYYNMSIEEVLECIEPDIQVSNIPVRPGETERKDVFSEVERKQMKLLINIEAQKKFYVSYKYVTRGIYYGARMISAQIDKEFVQPHYEDIKKVYSIWICMNAPKKIGNAMTVYQIEKHNTVGAMPTNKENYDKLSIVVICLNEKTKKIRRNCIGC